MKIRIFSLFTILDRFPILIDKIFAILVCENLLVLFDSEELATEFAREHGLLLSDQVLNNLIGGAACALGTHVCTQKVDIFLVYLGTVASYDKIDVRFVIRNPENSWKRIFSKI